MKTSIATVSISGDLKEKLSAIALAGFDGVEIFENDFLTFDETPATVGQMVRDAGLQITLFQPFRDFEGLPEPHRSRAFDRAERKFDLMQELGTDLMLVCSSISPLSIGGIDRAAADFAELGERAQKRGLRVGYEALAWGRHINDHRDAWEIVRRADHPNIGIILDSFHTLSHKIDVKSIRAIPGDRIFLVQLADAPLIAMDTLYWSRHFRNMPGQGDLPVREFMQAVASTGYDGPLSLEIFNDQFRGASARSIARDGHRSLVNLMDQVYRAEPEVVRGRVPNMPAPIETFGIEFIQFAAGGEAAGELSRLFKAAGFTRTAKHVSKDITLWRQGGVNLLVNSHTSGFARTAFLAHGITVCDIGLKVEDAGATVARAEALGAESFVEFIGPGELSIPAIRGLGGGLMHFIDEMSELEQLWEIDFRSIEPEAPVADAALIGIDHIAQSMLHDEMLTWLLFYISIFDAEKAPMVDVVDPAGLVRSQVIENGNKSFRLILNGAENPRTVAGQFVAESFGSAVQHIAFASSDIFKTADALEKNGFPVLAISPNYYDDLEARFGLDPAFSARLRAANILYDRDEDGEFFQLYGRSFGEGLFLEFLERRNGYRGYGAYNAPFRIAAQKRHLKPAASLETA
ncbi:4-hydroxyphenylpyruvate dioxygenase [Hartmannibacter diazotrophicus]|uniref:3-dehydroshikimate dehydratase n=1 Tax=Hartmannibacter diazotrophicus TaxID=1482074 RepID=A0A2C9D9B0_9HYPH|nr:sugar phosphate isomerase/epimerase and 4-hydroxyphenylpyruvate domain-containing protein [Hartmannibacter diazotrophicus]SON56887.1 4-hydroxyphenylpyruvate dioxygenase [Hartmannibacter diazotrophicus]